jgi:hypothetical protein
MLLLQLCVHRHIHTCGPINVLIPVTHTFRMRLHFVCIWHVNSVNGLTWAIYFLSVLCSPCFFFFLVPFGSLFFSILLGVNMCFSSHFSNTIVKVLMSNYFVSLVIWGHGTTMCHYIFMVSSCFCNFYIKFCLQVFGRL